MGGRRGGSGLRVVVLGVMALVLGTSVACQPVPGFPPTPPGPGTTWIRLTTDPGWHGGDVSYPAFDRIYTPADARVSIWQYQGFLNFSIEGVDRVDGRMSDGTANGLGPLQAGTYEAGSGPLDSTDPLTIPHPYLGLGQCNYAGFEEVGSFTVDEITYQPDGQLATLAASFESRCQGSDSAYRGELHYDVSDTTRPNVPVANDPNAWRPPAGSVPETGNYLYVDKGDGTTPSLVTNANSIFRATATGGPSSQGSLVLSNDSDIDRSITIGSDYSSNWIVPGTYVTNLTRSTPADPLVGMDRENDIGCTPATYVGQWAAVDRLDTTPATSTEATVQLAEVRVERTCSDGRIIHVAARYDATDTSVPPGPVAIPDGLWRAPAGMIPAGNSFYLEGDTDDFLPGGFPLLVRPSDTIGPARAGGASIRYDFFAVVAINGRPTAYDVEFGAMVGQSRIVEGAYPFVTRWPYGNPARGRLSIAGNGVTCNESLGWVAIDHVAYDDAGRVTAIDMRFAQVCTDSVPAPVRGELHWRS